MILKICFLLAVSVAWEVSGASYSNVFVKTGPEVEYLEYGAPSPSYTYEYPSSQVAQYNAAPFAYEYPFGQSYSFRTAYPEQTVAALAPAAPSTNILTYNSAPVANVPYVYGRNEPSSYSYVLVNQGGGQELKLSDGEVIRGGYTFVQPEGLVPYVADNNQGLNAIIKSYVPYEPVAQTEIIHHASVHHAEPCHEAKSEALTARASLEESHEQPHESHEHHKSEQDPEKEHDSNHESHEARHGSHEEPEIHEYVIHNSHSHSESGSHESGHHSHGETIIVIKEAEEGEHESHEHETEESHEIEHVLQIVEEHDGHHKEENEEPSHESGSNEQHTHEAIIEITREPHESHEHHEVLVAPQPVATVAPVAPVPGLVGNNIYISYNDFIKCIQAVMARGNTHPYYNTPVAQPTSPLTYLIYNKPC